MAPGISIIVCCYNSSARLRDTLNYLVHQNADGFGLEIIIVDNASSDDTATLAKTILSASRSLDFAIVNEPEPGLSFARKRGYLTAKYEYLLFCDDDNWLAENYAQLAYQTLSKNQKIGILGGRAEAVFESAEPWWFKQYEIDFAVGEQSQSVQSLSKVKEVYGAGFTIRKSYLDKLYASGFKSILSDRKGDQLISGGDVELCYLAKYFGYEVWYQRELRLKHFMTASRLTWPYMKKLYCGNGKTNVYTLAYQYIEEHNTVPGKGLRFPFWLDTFIHKAKTIIRFYPKVKGNMHKEGDANVLRYIAMKAEAREIWELKENYLLVYKSILSYLNQLNQKSNANPVTE